MNDFKWNVKPDRGQHVFIELVFQLIEPEPHWHAISLPALKGTPAPTVPLSDTQVTSKYEHARQLLDQENAAAESHPSLSSSDRSFLSDILKSGTLNDKVSALTLLVQESPIHALRTMDTLMSMSKKKSRKEAVQAITSLKDLFIGSVLPDRKLIYFRDRPIWDKGVKDEHLVVWAYEDFLKKYFFEFLQTIEVKAGSMLKSMGGIIFQLLMTNLNLSGIVPRYPLARSPQYGYLYAWSSCW